MRIDRTGPAYAKWLTMDVHAIEPDVDAGVLLAGAQYIDAFRIAVDGTALDARRAAERMMARGPRWIETLMRLRNRLVAPFGLKTPLPTGAAAATPSEYFRL
jgi:hypothetical protein